MPTKIIFRQLNSPHHPCWATYLEVPDGRVCLGVLANENGYVHFIRAKNIVLTEEEAGIIGDFIKRVKAKSCE
jgi:hypothetical protein